MKLSTSIKLVWQLAAQETIAAKFKEIEPEHFCMALLKFSELPVEKVDNIDPGAEAVRELASEAAAVRKELEARSIDSMAVRHQLRAELSEGNHPYNGGQIHRAQASRDLLEMAARLSDDAGSETLAASHLLAAILASPTNVMAHVLANTNGCRSTGHSKLSLLDEFGKNLVQMAADEKPVSVSGREAESKALILVLTQMDCRYVFLVSRCYL